MGGNSENPYAGQGPVLLDIGGDVGALVVVMPTDTEGLEVELRPVGATHGHTHSHAHSHDHSHDHSRGHSQDHSHGGGDRHLHAHPAYPHVAVVARPEGDGVIHTLVYPSVAEGEYELFVLPDGPVAMTASVLGGRITRNRWPA
ncbi:hypothetical protein BJ986_000609 [Phycicoccus badiiscoriae]|uniref:Uncharacterized protein n=1 Tax=Pedococcus badiiscoriae TaxID=642776 RepID=A0A852WLG8_9MICO|nr:hypothetical protein [Pedococcus badiiscoriae]NYG06122.1 hypothetical protein [Pedococcus badiiscoriae]